MILHWCAWMRQKSFPPGHGRGPFRKDIAAVPDNDPNVMSQRKYEQLVWANRAGTSCRYTRTREPQSFSEQFWPTPGKWRTRKLEIHLEVYGVSRDFRFALSNNSMKRFGLQSQTHNWEE